jgi:hypothetical protein
MIRGRALAVAIALLSPAAEHPRFAEDFPPEAGYVAVLEIIPDEDGIAKTCRLINVYDLAEKTPTVKISPPDAYVMDACRKLRTAKWRVKRDEAGNIEAQSYFCRYVESTPKIAFCDRGLGE